jgi:hypothetical protein
MRVKVIVVTMVSSGIRIGAWNYLNRGHLKPIQKDGKMVACRLTVYAGTPDEYVTFITPEAYETIEQYLSCRFEQFVPSLFGCGGVDSGASRPNQELHLIGQWQSTHVPR